ncbi:hypothetical protein DFJ73DRAFT_831854, partial [Zopfochytrium polystomum]
MDQPSFATLLTQLAATPTADLVASTGFLGDNLVGRLPAECVEAAVALFDRPGLTALRASTLRSAALLYPLELALIAPHLLAQITPESFLDLISCLELSIPDEWSRCMVALQYSRWRAAATSPTDLPHPPPPPPDASCPTIPLSYTRLQQLRTRLTLARVPSRPSAFVLAAPASRLPHEPLPKSAVDLGAHAAIFTSLHKAPALAQFATRHDGSVKRVPAFLKAKDEYVRFRRWIVEGRVVPALDCGVVAPGFRFAMRLPVTEAVSAVAAEIRRAGVESATGTATQGERRADACRRLCEALGALESDEVSIVVAKFKVVMGGDAAAGVVNFYLVRIKQQQPHEPTAKGKFTVVPGRLVDKHPITASSYKITDEAPVSIVVAAVLGGERGFLAGHDTSTEGEQYHLLNVGQAILLFSVPLETFADLVVPQMGDFGPLVDLLDDMIMKDSGYTDGEIDSISKKVIAGRSSFLRPRILLSFLINVLGPPSI